MKVEFISNINPPTLLIVPENVDEKFEIEKIRDRIEQALDNLLDEDLMGINCNGEMEINVRTFQMPEVS